MQNPKKIHRRKISYIWGLLAVLQSVTLLIFFLTWPQQPVTLTLVVPDPEVFHWSSLIRDFHTKNPDIRIELVEGLYTTDEVKAIYTSAFQAGNSSYDLVYMDVIWLTQFAVSGWLRDLSGQISAAELAQFLDDDVDRGRYQKGLYRIPFRADAGVLFYRKDLLKQKGDRPPKTFAQLQQISQNLQQSQLVPWGYFWQGVEYEGLVATFFEVLSGYGGYWIHPTTNEVGLDRPEAIAAIQFLRDTIKQKISPEYVTTYIEEDSFREFVQGKAVFLRSWPYIWARADANNSPLKGKIGITQIVSAPGYSSAACRGGWGFGIAKNARYPKEAWRAIQFFTSAEVQRKFVLESSYLPSRKALFRDREIVKKYPHFPEMLQIVENAVFRPRISQYDLASKILQCHLSAALSDKLSPEAAMRSAAKETRELLGKSQTKRAICNI